MNAFLLMSACMAGADPTVVTVSHNTSSACCSTPAPSCDSGCNKASFLDKIRARFAKSDSCCESKPKCCEKAAPTCCAKPAPVCCPAPAPVCCEAPKCCEKAPKCKPACGTPLFSKKDSCDTGCDSCASKPSLLDKLRAKFASKKSCCESAPACGGCATAPAGCSLPPAAAPSAPGEAPKVMPAPVPVAPKQSTSLIVPAPVTPASSSTSPEFVVPAIPQIAPPPTPVLGGSKSPF